MSKLAHHHPVSPAMGRVQDWFGKVIIAVAVIGGAVVLFTAITSHGNVTW